MGYWTRILGTQDPDVNIKDIINALFTNGMSATIEVGKDELPNCWTILEVANNKGQALVQIERNSVVDGSLGSEELMEFAEDIQDLRPESSVKWLTEYFKKVRVIYAFQMLNASFESGNFEIVSTIREMIWAKTGGILQADNEGFSNEKGYTIVWQFDNSVKGEWCCAVVGAQGKWQNFKMDLGNVKQRHEFQDGLVPIDAILL